jgi:hypothetical protein
VVEIYIKRRGQIFDFSDVLYSFQLGFHEKWFLPGNGREEKSVLPGWDFITVWYTRKACYMLYRVLYETGTNQATHILYKRGVCVYPE